MRRSRSLRCRTRVALAHPPGRRSSLLPRVGRVPPFHAAATSPAIAQGSRQQPGLSGGVGVVVAQDRAAVLLTDEEKLVFPFTLALQGREATSEQHECSVRQREHGQISPRCLRARSIVDDEVVPRHDRATPDIGLEDLRKRMQDVGVRGLAAIVGDAANGRSASRRRVRVRGPGGADCRCRRPAARTRIALQESERCAGRAVSDRALHSGPCATGFIRPTLAFSREVHHPECII